MNTRRKPLIIASVSLLIFAGAGYGLYAWSQQPSGLSAAELQTQNSATVASAAVKDSDAKSGQSNNEIWKTAYFSSLMPSGLELRSSREDTRQPVVGNYVLSAPAGAGSMAGQIAASVGELHGGALAELSAVKLRLSQPGEYTPAQRDYVPANALVFSRTDSYETDIFWQHDGQYVALVASGSAMHQSDFEDDLKLIVQHWQWL